MTTVYWLSPVPGFCETCNSPIRDKFYDAPTRNAQGRPGPWACMCPSCFTLGSGFRKLGSGYGQEYTKQPDGKWLKTGG